VILTSKCGAIGAGAITTYFNVLRLTRSAQVGLELTTSRMLRENTTPKLPQLVMNTTQTSTTFEIREQKKDLFKVE
jgi:hypothetical protein